MLSQRTKKSIKLIAGPNRLKCKYKFKFKDMLMSYIPETGIIVLNVSIVMSIVSS